MVWQLVRRPPGRRQRLRSERTALCSRRCHPSRHLRRRRRLQRMGNDIRLGLRGLRRAPAFALTAILTLAIGIGLATAVFTVANAFLLRPLPIREPDRVVVLWGR